MTKQQGNHLQALSDEEFERVCDTRIICQTCFTEVYVPIELELFNLAEEWISRHQTPTGHWSWTGFQPIERHAFLLMIGVMILLTHRPVCWWFVHSSRIFTLPCGCPKHGQNFGVSSLKQRIALGKSERRSGRVLLQRKPTERISFIKTRTCCLEMINWTCVD